MAHLYFTSDAHWGHGNIIKYCSRPFKDTAHMLGELVKRWNDRVTPDDTVCHLGDWCFTGRVGETKKAHEYEAMLNGKIIHVKGNHDRNNSLRFAFEIATIRLGGILTLLKHHPPRNSGDVPNGVDLILCGHVHGAFKHAWIKVRGVDKLIINVGIDVWNYAPVRSDEILGYYTSVINKEKENRVYIESFYEQNKI